MIKIPLVQLIGSLDRSWWAVGTNKRTLYSSADGFLLNVKNKFNVESPILNGDFRLFALKVSTRKFKDSQGHVELYNYDFRNYEYTYNYKGTHFRICGSGIREFFPTGDAPKKLYFQMIPRSR